MSPYRSDHEALVAQCASLRAQLSSAKEGSAELEQVRAELEAKLSELEKSRISEAEKVLAGKRLQLKGAMLGLSLGLLCVGGLFAYLSMEKEDKEAGPATGATWFAEAKAHCNPVEVAIHMRRAPAPAGQEGTTYTAACYALAGKMNEARAAIDSLESGQRAQAASLVFNVVHPIADAGDDVAAGPAMEFVLEYVPDNFMALYHAGMSAHETGNPEDAEKYLKKFLLLYAPEDGWRKNALDVLELIEAD
jgi:cytochrome c-type biogenesis protein CcmH/NrfG